MQGNAVRCLKKIATKLPEAALDDVINKLGQCLLEGKKEFKDIYATCIKGFIADIPDTSSHVIIDILFPILNSGLNVEGA